MKLLETPFIDYNISYVAVGAGLTSPFKKGTIKALAEELNIKNQSWSFFQQFINRAAKRFWCQPLRLKCMCQWGEVDLV